MLTDTSHKDTLTDTTNKDTLTDTTNKDTLTDTTNKDRLTDTTNGMIDLTVYMKRVSVRTDCLAEHNVVCTLLLIRTSSVTFQCTSVWTFTEYRHYNYIHYPLRTMH